MQKTPEIETKEPHVMQEEIRKRLREKVFIGFRGEMGAGKTTLISEMLKDQNVTVSSPTFSLYNSYKINNLEIMHADLYRLQNAEEIDSSGFWDLFGNSTSVILAEWVDRLDWSELPIDWQKWLVQIQVQEDESRIYSLFRV